VPHDYVIEGAFDTKVDKGVDPEWYKHHGYRPLKSAWYRKAILIPNAAKGRLAPVANSEVVFTLAGPGKLIGVGNGDCSSHEPDKSSRRSAFNGLAQAIVQTTAKAGNIILKAEAADLKAGTITLSSK
jgi:hypothetical protein